MRILIADHNPATTEDLQQTLHGAGYETTLAGNIRRVRAAVHAGVCHLAIINWELPDHQASLICREIREHSTLGYVYVIFLTNECRPEQTIQGLQAGADDVIACPFNPAELLVRIQAGERIISLESRDLTIFALARLAESRDPETGAHVERVRNYAQTLACQLLGHPRFTPEIDANFIRLIYLTSPLHDIGKIGIPDSILLKPGPLTPHEYEVMKTHTTLGARTLDDALRAYPGASFLRMARDIAASHHEHYDGSGYPNGLTCDEIPLCGRIVALADVYDALTSKRVYKDAFSHERSRDIIVEESGRHFDPDVVQAFLASEDQFQAIQAQFHDDGIDPRLAVA